MGPEASYVRAGRLVTDELRLSGFGARSGDLERLASLGAARIRFPLLWERTSPGGVPDWTWADRALPRAAAVGLQPVVGLVHHGGGPLPGGLLDPGFAEGLAAYAGAVARRFPWVGAYTPVNEPLTTARFSALYGLWFPHAHDDASFVQALLHQLRGTVLSMEAVRRVNPDAALIQTEDLGRVYSTPALQEQADFENLRRWLSFDLLCGRVDERHGLWSYLRWAGAAEDQLLWFAEHPCPPQVLGLNIYPTSERFLDERLERYPAPTYGGNGRQVYADVEAVRVRAEPPEFFYQRLMEAHDRYGLPLAVTEVHLGCTREEQLRWLNGAWQQAQRARRDGADVRAVTAWAAFGSFEWDSLLTRHHGYVETGLWDPASDPPRETALADLARALAAGRDLDHPVLKGPGWWERRGRVHFPQDGQETEGRAVGGRTIDIAPGPLCPALTERCRRRGLPTGPAGEDSDPWATAHTGPGGRLHLRWKGRDDLILTAAPWTTPRLDAALDLLQDGETGRWIWNGEGFSALGREGSGPRSGRSLEAVS